MKRSASVAGVKMKPEVEKCANEVKLQRLAGEGVEMGKRGVTTYWISLCSLLKLA